MITCFLTNWGVTIALGLLLTLSEWLAKTKKFEENGLFDLTTHFLKSILILVKLRRTKVCPSLKLEWCMMLRLNQSQTWAQHLR